MAAAATITVAVVAAVAAVVALAVVPVAVTVVVVAGAAGEVHGPAGTAEVLARTPGGLGALGVRHHGVRRVVDAAVTFRAGDGEAEARARKTLEHVVELADLRVARARLGEPLRIARGVEVDLAKLPATPGTVGDLVLAGRRQGDRDRTRALTPAVLVVAVQRGCGDRGPAGSGHAELESGTLVVVVAVVVVAVVVVAVVVVALVIVVRPPHDEVGRAFGAAVREVGDVGALIGEPADGARGEVDGVEPAVARGGLRVQRAPGEGELHQPGASGRGVVTQRRAPPLAGRVGLTAEEHAGVEIERVGAGVEDAGALVHRHVPEPQVAVPGEHVVEQVLGPREVPGRPVEGEPDELGVARVRPRDLGGHVVELPAVHPARGHELQRKVARDVLARQGIVEIDPGDEPVLRCATRTGPVVETVGLPVQREPVGVEGIALHRGQRRHELGHAGVHVEAPDDPVGAVAQLDAVDPVRRRRLCGRHAGDRRHGQPRENGTNGQTSHRHNSPSWRWPVSPLAPRRGG